MRVVACKRKKQTYNHYELADYLLSKGADDSLLNAEGLTCYEGLHRADVSAL